MKLVNKIADKTCNNTSYTTFTLVPVILANVRILQELAVMYKTENRVTVPNVREPVAYRNFADPDNFPIYRLYHVSSLISDGQILIEWIDDILNISPLLRGLFLKALHYALPGREIEPTKPFTGRG